MSRNTARGTVPEGFAFSVLPLREAGCCASQLNPRVIGYDTLLSAAGVDNAKLVAWNPTKGGGLHG
jgi:hypothetical protein